MRGDKEMGTVVAAQIVKEEGPSRDGDTNAGGESGQGGFGAGESGGDGDCGEYGRTMLEVCQARSPMHHAQWQGTMRELPSEALWVLARAAEGGRGRQRWAVGVPEGEGGRGEPAGKGAGMESPKGHYARYVLSIKVLLSLT